MTSAEGGSTWSRGVISAGTVPEFRRYPGRLAASADIALRAPGGPELAARLWPAPPGTPAVLILPGLGSRKENHLDFGEALAGAGIGALALDLRGHGASRGELDGGCLDDVRAALDLLQARGHAPLGVRGSSMGGMLALVAAGRDRRVAAAVAICPSRPGPLADRIGADWPRALSLRDAVSRPGVARGLWHAAGDDQVPWASTFALAGLCPQPRRLRIAMGGDHGSLQHEPAALAETVAFLAEHLGANGHR